jgi:hypothetical protein
MCSRTGITIEGCSAEKCDETYCGNYEEGIGGCGCGQPDALTEITCDATNCDHNIDCSCNAEDVAIVDSRGRGQTKCACFAAS